MGYKGPQDIYIKAPSEKFYVVKQEVRRGRVVLGVGWPKIVREESVFKGDIACFEYLGNARFKMTLFDCLLVEKFRIITDNHARDANVGE